MTIQDHSILETMLTASTEPDEPFANLLRRKLASATIWAGEDIAPTVVTLDSRVSYRIDGQPAERRILSLRESHGPVGTVLPVTTLRGLALIGLEEGESFGITRNGNVESLSVVEVLYQPEAASREARYLTPRPGARTHLRLVHSAETTPRIISAPGGQDQDDPGPSAA